MTRTLLSAAALFALVGVGVAALPSDAEARGPRAGRCSAIFEEVKRADCINGLAAAAPAASVSKARGKGKAAKHVSAKKKPAAAKKVHQASKKR